ncbi:gluconokinase [Pseudohoeflea suaedae]|uniref:Gluconokinase n=1 Tax=Pseudohoeflea suaedae TaxID=877384 RepID=A0A4R5PNF9_9HYPH|nr:gluconokinase [Pseudohoeflea suaedae]TDH38363.1 gluconokinase [Pseudohoeflea suaedae]
MTQAQQTGGHHADHFIVMGVAGAGKSTIAELLAERLGYPLVEGDAHHPQANIEKMSAGIPLDDSDRAPWLEELGALMRRSDGPVVLTCSSLKRKYRDLLRGSSGSDILFVYLHGSRKLLSERMNSRTGHFMPPSLLESQLESLEVPGDDENSLRVDIGPKPEVIVDRIIASLNSRA